MFLGQVWGALPLFLLLEIHYEHLHALSVLLSAHASYAASFLHLSCPISGQTLRHLLSGPPPLPAPVVPSLYWGQSSRVCVQIWVYSSPAHILPKGHQETPIEATDLKSMFTKCRSNKWLMSSMLVSQSCLPLCNHMDCIPPGSSVHGILQARILEWGCCFLLKRIFLNQESNLGLQHYRQILYHLSHQGSPLVYVRNYKKQD